MQIHVESSNSNDDTTFGAVWSGNPRELWWELFFLMSHSISQVVADELAPQLPRKHRVPRHALA